MHVEYIQAPGRPGYYFRPGTAHLNRMVQAERGGECGPTRNDCPTRNESPTRDICRADTRFRKERKHDSIDS